MIELQNKKVLVTGSEGFVGRHLCNALEKIQANVIKVDHNKFELTNPEDVYYILHDNKPDYVISLAANTGGIVYNKQYPATLFYDNILISTNLLKACAQSKIKKVINITTSCSYPDGLEVLYEKDYWNGRPNESVEFFGIAKRASECFGRALNKEYGLNVVTACVTNLYGPYDNFSINGKVVAGLIHKFVEGKQEKYSSVTCFGTGAPKRELMYVEDAAQALIRVLQYYDDVSLPINIGVGTDVSIRYLADTIRTLVGYEGEIKWNTSFSDGQMKKLLDVTRMHQYLNYYPGTSLEKGLKTTIQWFIDNKGYCEI